MNQCRHLHAIQPAPPSSDGCLECLRTGSRWVHLRRCATCGHVGCCDSSPNRHATGHFRATVHPLIQSFEPGEDWYWCYVDDVAFEIPGQGPSPSHSAHSTP
jgi:uncharacterized UBP type Zn finger protein